MSELGFNTDWTNPSLPSAKDDSLPFQVLVTTDYGTTTFSRHATAQEAWDEAVKQHGATVGDDYCAIDENGTPLTDGYFRKTEERYEDLVAGIRI